MQSLLKIKHGETEAKWASLKDQLDFRKRTEESYIYKPLNTDRPEIRLLTLLKGKRSDQVRILIYITTLSDQDAFRVPEFEAISYAWGDPQDTVDLFVGRSGRPLSVSRNLATALSHLRHEAHDRTLWADAVCINQKIWQNAGIKYKIWLGRDHATVSCGKQDISWRWLEDAIRHFHFQYLEGHLESGIFVDLIKSLRPLWYLCVCIGSDYTLLDLIGQFHLCACSNPLDRVYAVLSIVAPWEKALKIVPDYTKLEADVFREICLAYVANMKSLTFLEHCTLTEDELAQAPPTWVPRFDPRFGLNPTPWDYFPTASGTFVADSKYLGNGILGVLGREWDTVHLITMPLSRDYEYSLEYLVAKIRSELPIGGHKKPYGDGGTLLEAYCRTLYSGGFGDDWIPSHESRPDYDRVLTFLVSLSEMSPEREWSEDNIERKLRRDLLQILATRVQQRFFVTSERHAFGFSAGAVVPGDKVCDLLGSDSPLCLRPVASGRYQVVGRCNVHGLTDAEAFLGPLPPNIKRRMDTKIYPRSYVSVYEDTLSGAKSHRDPRLMKLLGDSVAREDTENCFDYRKLAVSMMTPEKLRERNIPLQTFELI